VENAVPALVKVLTASVVLSLLTISIASGGSDSLESYALGVHVYSLFAAAVVGKKRALAHSFREAWIILTGTFGLAGAWMINWVDFFPVVVSGLLSVGFAAALSAHQLWSFTQRTKESLRTYADRFVLRVFVSHVALSLAIFLVALGFDLGIADPGPSARPVTNAAAERVDSSGAEAEKASPRSPIAFNPERFTMTYISPVNARLYVRVEDDEWTDYGVRFQKIRDGDTTRVTNPKDGPPAGPNRAMPLDLWQRGDTVRVVVESLPRTAPGSGETQPRVVQGVYDEEVEAVTERFEDIRARRSAVVDTLRRTAVIEDGFSLRLTVRFLEAADGSVYVDAVSDARVDLQDAQVFVRRDGRTYNTVPTADHGALARILDIKTGDEIRISVRRVGPSAPDDGEDVTLTTSYPGPPRSAAISASDVDGRRDTRSLFID
jgi:putative flippase GtrA